MFFGAADKIAAVIREAKRGAVILRMRSVPAVDATGLHSLQTIVKACKKKNIVLVMSHVNEQPMKIFKKSGMYETIGEENFCENIDVALERAKAITEG